MIIIIPPTNDPIFTYSYEIRAYDPYVVAEVDSSEGDNASFRTLASYIGVGRLGD